jgi:pimeloyl-ACP methyl ester carboxylesterase
VITDPIAPVAARFSIRHLRVEDGVELRVLRWVPERTTTRAPIVFVAGWVSVVGGWAPLLRVLAQERPIHYIETREKRSARIDRKKLRVEEFGIERLAKDLIRVSSALEIGDRAIFFGSSMGSNAILEALKHGGQRAHAAFLVGPNSHFAFPWWGRCFLVMPAWGYHAFKHFVLWYLRNYRVNMKDDPGQMLRYDRTLRAAHPLRLKLSAKAVQQYQVWPGLETIDVPVAIAYGSSDTLHGEEDVKRIVARLPRGKAIPCPSSTYMHTAAVAEDLSGFLDIIPR